MHHAVVGGDQQQAAAGSRSAIDRASWSTWVSWNRHGSEPGSVHVAEQVEVAVVGVPERAVGLGLAGERRGQVAERAHAPVLAAAQHRPGQPAAEERPRHGDPDRDAVRGQPLERRRHRLHVLRHEPLAQVPRAAGALGGPAQRVDRDAVADLEGQPDHAVPAGRQAGADAGQAGRGGGREAGGDLAGRAGWTGTGRRRRTAAAGAGRARRRAAGRRAGLRAGPARSFRPAPRAPRARPGSGRTTHRHRRQAPRPRA